jgi:hypothetical protein
VKDKIYDSEYCIWKKMITGKFLMASEIERERGAKEREKENKEIDQTQRKRRERKMYIER